MKKLKPDGKDTALLDAIGYCLERFEELAKTLGNADVPHYLITLTDGGDNFSLNTSALAYAHALQSKSKKLHILGHLFQVGDKSRKGSRMMSHALGYKFHHFNGGNAGESLQSFLQELSGNTEAVRVSMSNNRREQMANQQQAKDLENRLPSVPTTTDRAHKERELA